MRKVEKGGLLTEEQASAAGSNGAEPDVPANQ